MFTILLKIPSSGPGKSLLAIQWHSENRGDTYSHDLSELNFVLLLASNTMLLSTILPVALSLGVGAQQVAYTEKGSGITVQAFSNANLVFGIALPPEPTTDFIGVVVGKGSGYVGISLNGPMTQNSLLLATWPNGKALMSSFRKTSSYGSPPVANGPFTVVPIANGTYTNTTHFVSTFICKNCILADGTTFGSADTTNAIGWAFSTAAPKTKASASTAFSKHQSQGNYQADLTTARTADYAKWAAYAPNATMLTGKRGEAFKG
ncbi:hypothetical protein BJ875DRAFT_480952 [Amylocarpus encephaloides]|uniref:Cellobiose dehydrogenase-like cytochrome domain-containing protein n=1 Tax=Amylocarpus encephaloides TaxID=45428 RepID=A0A9P8C8E7_9HELO|nr:hypothetical protein BJ875DRAFT_480952 [Amylocarpus encephaloides]